MSNIDDTFERVGALIDKAVEAASGDKQSCCVGHLTEAIKSVLVKNLVRVIMAEVSTLEDRLASSADMKVASLELIVLMKGYYEAAREAHATKDSQHKPTGVKLH